MISTVIAAVVVSAILAQESMELEPLEPVRQPVEALEPARNPVSDIPNTRLQPTRSTGSVYLPGTEVRVAATSLGFRSGPGADAPLIHYIPEHDRLTVLHDVNSPVEEILAGRPGWWIYVQHAARRGYVFDAYVQLAPAPVEQTMEFTCVPGRSVGPISRQTQYAVLESTFGGENLEETEVDFGGGTVERVTVVFAGTDKELRVRWQVYQQSPISVEIVGPIWQTPKGIAVGTPVSVLEKLNGGHFAFYGFGWEFAGRVTSWEGGSLEFDHTLRDRVDLVLAPLQPYLDADMERLQGTIEYTSDHPMASRVNLRVSSMTIMLNP